MKQFSLLVGLGLCLALVSCSKPAEPEVVSDEKVKSKYTLNVTPKVHKPKVVPEGFKVIVLDEETEQVIKNAHVKLEWYDEFVNQSLNAINMDDGSYIICTNKFQKLKISRVILTAQGYLPKIKNKPKFPLTIKMKSGETIKVFGKIFDQKGSGVPDAKLRIRAVSPSSLNREVQQALWACSTTSDSEENYEIAALPVDIENLYIDFSHYDYPMVDFTNSLFNSLGGDVELDLYLPQFLELKGQVRTDLGEPVAKAKVWAVKCDQIDAYLRRADFMQFSAIDCRSTLTDSNGFFNLRLKGKEDNYAVKASTKMYQPAIAGVFTPNNPAPDFIDLVFKTEGARLVGSITNKDGLPIINAQVSTVIHAKGYARLMKLGIEIDAEGKYISQIVHDGTHELSFSAPAHESLQQKVVVRANEMTFVDVVLSDNEKIEGVVLDPFTKEPISGVILSNRYVLADLKMSAMTDAAGKFWVESDGTLTISFFHPKYVTVEKMLVGGKENVVYMSQSSALTVNVTGIPVDQEKKYTVGLLDNKGQALTAKFNLGLMRNQPIVNGTTTFTNLPVHFSPVTVTIETIVKSADGNKITSSKPVELVAGKTTDVDIEFPAIGKLVVNFDQTFDKNAHHFSGASKVGKFYLSSYSGCKVESKSLTWNSVPTNQYKIGFSAYGKGILQSNIVINAGETTKIFIDIDTNKCAKIFGVTKFEDSTPFRCKIRAYAENSKQPEYARPQTGDFEINNLNPNLAYTLKVQLDCIGSTNLVFENIRPSSEAIELSLGSAYKIYGNVMDADGKPIDGVTLKWNKLEPGFFEIYPVLEGKHKIKFEAKGYEPVEKEIIIYGKDQDLGDVYLYEEEGK